MKRLKSFKIYLLLILFAILYSCGDSDTIEDIEDDLSGNIFFSESEIRVERNSGASLEVIIRYVGPQRNEDITGTYSISFPASNAAVEGEDFLLQQNFDFIIPQGMTSVTVPLIQSILENPEATEVRSVVFELNEVPGLTLGAPDSGGNSTIEIFIESDSSPVAEGFIGNKEFFISKNGINFKIPYFSNVEDITNTNNVNITRAVVVIHGSGRNSNSSFSSMTEAANIEGFAEENLLIIAPQYVGEEEINNFTLDNDHLYWTGPWRSGALSRDEDTNPRPERISSFTVMDSLLTTLMQYPNLQDIILTGHSAGGQFVNRYSASSPIPDDIEANGIDIRFIPNNPASYTYMDDRRLVQGTTNTFERPTDTEVLNCIEFNDYIYGLDDLFTYLDDIGVETIRQRLPQREVIYLVGSNDNNPNFPGLDRRCQALLLGQHRLERGINYFNYLQFYYNDVFNIDITETQKMEIVPRVGHSSSGMYQSEIGRRYTFRD